MPLLVAIVGGSGSGKTHLARQLQTALGANAAAHISLDAFYRDRSNVPLRRRSGINFDHPRAIDWKGVEATLDAIAKGLAAPLPRYSFRTHCRLHREALLRPKPIALIDGLWLLHRRSLRRRFAMSIFIRCNSRTRLQRRLARDCRSRGRTAQSVRSQFARSVEPMHARFVAPQERWADVVLRHDFGAAEIQNLARQLQTWLNVTQPADHSPTRNSRHQSHSKNSQFK